MLSVAKSRRTLKSYTGSSIHISLRNKLEKVRAKIIADNDKYIDEEHEKLCLNYAKYLEFDKNRDKAEYKGKETEYQGYYEQYKAIKDTLKLKEEMKTFRYITDNIKQNEQQQILFQNIKDKTNNIPFSYTNYNYKIIFNTYNRKFINNVGKNIDYDLYQRFIAKQDTFIRSLNIRELYILKQYTFQGDAIISSYLNGQFDISQLDIDYNESTLFYFQFYDYFKQNPLYNGMQISVDDIEFFIRFLKLQYNNFNQEIYKFVIELYIKELTEIFEKAPETEDVMFLYRGVGDNYVNRTVAEKKTGGYFISKRFTSTSLFPKIAYNYAIGTRSNILYEIKIDKGVKAIFLAGISFFKDEMEVLLPINTTFYIDYANMKKKFYNDKTILCDNDRTYVKEMNITSLVVI